MRINKYLAHKGYCTRRGADELIASGKVFLNGVPAVLGDKIEQHDAVEVRNALPQSFVYLAYYKPRGIVTHGAQGNEKEIADLIRVRDPKLEVFPVGRLDKNSHGLILLTNDGRIVEPLLSPDRPHEKEYVVTVNERLRSDFADTMAAGVNIGGYTTKPCTVKRVSRNVFRITLTEGKNHQIKRMASALGYTVTDLKRVRIMNVTLRRLHPGTYRYIKGDTLTTLLQQLHVHEEAR